MFGTVVDQGQAVYTTGNEESFVVLSLDKYHVHHNAVLQLGAASSANSQISWGQNFFWRRTFFAPSCQKLRIITPYFEVNSCAKM